MSGYAKTVATDLIAQLAGASFDIPYSISYNRMYITKLEDMEPAGSASSEMSIILAPVDLEYERTGWGAMNVKLTIGMAFQIMVADVTSDAEMDPLEKFVDDVCGWLIGPRKFANGYWSALEPKPIYGDQYNEHLRTQGKFFVPCLLQFFMDRSAA